MDDQSLKNVLAILRAVQASGGSISGAQFIQQLSLGQQPQQNFVSAPHKQELSPAATARVAAYILDQVSQARIVIENSQLVEEAKAGVRLALKSLEHAFVIANLNGSLQNIHNAAPGYISNFVILLSAAGLSTSFDVPQEATDLAADIDSFAAKFDDVALDPVVRDIARRHMAILSTLVRHIPIFGLEAAMSAYFELLTKLRRADSKTTDESKGALDEAMGTVKTWGERIGALDEVMSKGANLLERAKAAAPLLQYIPGLG